MTARGQPGRTSPNDPSGPATGGQSTARTVRSGPVAAGAAAGAVALAVLVSLVAIVASAVDFNLFPDEPGVAGDAGAFVVAVAVAGGGVAGGYVAGRAAGRAGVAHGLAVFAVLVTAAALVTLASAVAGVSAVNELVRILFRHGRPRAGMLLEYEGVVLTAVLLCAAVVGGFITDVRRWDDAERRRAGDPSR